MYGISVLYPHRKGYCFSRTAWHSFMWLAQKQIELSKFILKQKLLFRAAIKICSLFLGTNYTFPEMFADYFL